MAAAHERRRQAYEAQEKWAARISSTTQCLKTPPEEDPFKDLYEGCEFMDDIHGVPLDREEAIKARRVEMDYFRDMGVYTKVKREKWMRVISTKWLDTNKGDEDHPNYRARLVGREIKVNKRDDLFAATPPLESLRMIISICASNQRQRDHRDNYIIMSNDIKRAYFYAPATRPVYIAIPKEDFNEGDDDMVGELNLSLYGTRDAAKNWADTFTRRLEEIGFTTGLASPCNFFHSARKISLTVHGDDFTSTGRECELRWLEGQLRAKYDIKTNVLGPRPEHHQQIRVLNRIISWEADGITYEADQRHAEIIIKAMGVEKAVVTPGTREDATKSGPPTTTTLITQNFAQEEPRFPPSGSVGSHCHSRDRRLSDAGTEQGACRSGGDIDEKTDGHEKLENEEATKFRAMAARANYLAMDRPDVQYAVKEVARRMAAPCRADWMLLKRLARYLIRAPRAVLHFHWQSKPKDLDIFVDADWAGCKSSCRSTSGGAARAGWHPIKTWSITQAVIALSSGESELFSMTRGAAQGIGLMALGRDLGAYFEVKVHTDANATLGIVQRLGVGKLRHLNVQYLWIQERVRSGDVNIAKVPGFDNPADLLTKHVTAEELERHLDGLAITRHDNRAELAPHLSLIRLSDGEDVGGEADFWVESAEMVTRHHLRPRRSRFTPTRVRGAPPGKLLTSARVTRGRYEDTGEEFTVVDSWRARSTAHATTPRAWTGETRFWLRTECH